MWLLCAAACLRAFPVPCSERYDALVMRVMVVAVKAAVAADDLDKALHGVNAMRGMGCGCKPGKHTWQPTCWLQYLPMHGSCMKSSTVGFCLPMTVCIQQSQYQLTAAGMQES